MPQETEKIEKRNVIFCEGMDEKYFLIHYLNSEEMKEYSILSNDIQVIDFGGNEELERKLELLKISPGFNQVKFLLIIRDAENDAKKAVMQIQNSLRKNGFPVPKGPGEWESKESDITIGFLLFPTCSDIADAGTLEDLCLSILKQADHLTMTKEVQLFLEHLHGEYQREFPHKHKTVLHTYFSITDQLVGMKIGEAAKAQAFDWNSPNLEFLKNFLLKMAP